MYTSCLWLSTSSNESTLRTDWIFSFAGIQSGRVYGPHGPLEHAPGGSGEWPWPADGITWLRLRSTWGRDSFVEKDMKKWREMGYLCVLFATLLGAPIFCKLHHLFLCCLFFSIYYDLQFTVFFPSSVRMFRNSPRWVLDWKASELPVAFLVPGPFSRNAFRQSTKPLGSSKFSWAKCKIFVIPFEKIGFWYRT